MTSPVARDHPSYLGVRQPRRGVWISEIDHPILNVKVCLGTFDTAEKAARAYDEASRLTCGPRARTNFPPDQNSTKLLADDIRGNLLRVAPDASSPASESLPSSSSAEDQQSTRPGNIEACKGEELGMKALKEEDVDEMIKELLDDESIEIRL